MYLLHRFPTGTAGGASKASILSHGGRARHGGSSLFHYSTTVTKNRASFPNIARLVDAFRKYGHTEADLNPLQSKDNSSTRSAQLDPASYGVDVNSPDQIPLEGLCYLPGKTSATASEVVQHLKRSYCGPVASDLSYLSNPEEVEWLAERLEAIPYAELSAAEKLHVLKLMNDSEMFDQFLAKKFAQVKRYGLEGNEAMMPLLDALFHSAARHSSTNVVVGMPHRGRLNFLTGLLKYPLPALFHKMKGASEIPAGVRGTGDVLSHLATSVDLSYEGRLLHVSLMHNPSHLEAIAPVAVGKARAKQKVVSDAARQRVLALLIHGDAAVSGQGVIAESVAMSALPGYTVGGAVHLVVNNQLGFTTDQHLGRSTRYASDAAKLSDSPSVHVNAEAPEQCVQAARVAMDFRQRFRRDVWLDMIGYRRWGHNELDEPAFTQPLMYKNIRERRTIAKQYSERLMREGLLPEELLREHVTRVNSILENGMQEAKGWAFKSDALHLSGSKWSAFVQPTDMTARTVTGCDTGTLVDVGVASVKLPAGAAPHSRLERLFMATRVQKLQKNEPLDWPTCEALAFGSLMLEGYHVRISGQDVGRGTFSHRHVHIVDQNTQQVHVPLNHMAAEQGKLEAVNSLLSEFAVMGFEYGYSLEDPRTLVMWEAQFGDFNNGAQIIIDQFVASGEDKWLRQSGLVLQLPHGYDGAGPEHSSARMERFLQLCDGDAIKHTDQQTPNMSVIVPTTPANYFHALRRQMVRNYRKPLIIVGPKTLLRHPDAVSSLSDMGPGTAFQPVLPDTAAAAQADQVTRVVFLSGKVYYDLVRERASKNITNTAFIRLEELSPFPYAGVREQLAVYPNAKKFYWLQEEQQNAGGWSFVAPRLAHLLGGAERLQYIGRGPLSSAAVGTYTAHHAEVAALMRDAFSA